MTSLTSQCWMSSLMSSTTRMVATEPVTPTITRGFLVFCSPYCMYSKIQYNNNYNNQIVPRVLSTAPSFIPSSPFSYFMPSSFFLKWLSEKTLKDFSQSSLIPSIFSHIFFLGVPMLSTIYLKKKTNVRIEQTAKIRNMKGNPADSIR
jgi:hypothetical protein